MSHISRILPLALSLTLTLTGIAGWASVPRGVRSPAPIRQDDPSGDYVLNYMPLFSDYTLRDLTQVVTISCDGDSVALDGFCGWSQRYFDPSRVSVDRPIKGIVDDGFIRVDAGQVIGSYDDCDAVLMALTRDGALTPHGTYDMLIGEETIECFCDWAIVAVDSLGMHVGNLSGVSLPVMYPPSGRLTYTMTRGTVEEILVDMPVCYGFVVDNQGNERMDITSINPYIPDGHITTWSVTGNEARAINEIIQDKSFNSSNYQYALCSYFSHEGNTYYNNEIVADITDRAIITWPTGYSSMHNIAYTDQWALIDSSHSLHHGICSRATLVAIGEDPAPELVISGVADPAADPAAAVSYFTLQGEPIPHPSMPGIYIRLQGSSATKFIVTP